MPQLATHTPQLTKCTSHAASRVQTLTLQRFQARLTLFPKCFPPFPHGTCSLSYSGRYLAKDGTYHRISAPVPRNATLWTFNRIRSTKLWRMGVSPFILPLSGGRSQPRLMIEDLHTTSRGRALILGASSALFIRHY
jgi:hypothetical protein